MQELEDIITAKQFTYHQLVRSGTLAIYRQEHRASGTSRYEVIRIQCHKATIWPNGHTTPEREGYPPATAWGTHGWTFHTLAQAERHFGRLYSGQGG